MVNITNHAARPRTLSCFAFMLYPPSFSKSVDLFQAKIRHQPNLRPGQASVAAAQARYAVSPLHSSSYLALADPRRQFSSPVPTHRSRAVAIPPACPFVALPAPPRTRPGLSTSLAPAAARARVSIQTAAQHFPDLRVPAHTSPRPHPPFSATHLLPFLFLRESLEHPACRHPSSIVLEQPSALP